MQLTPPSPRSLILDLLSTLRERAVPVRALVDAAALFAIQENGLRVALARLLAAGSVMRDERGLYRLAPGAVLTHLLGWRQIEERSAPWSGRWFAVHSAALSRRAGRALRLRERALRFLGFRALLPGFELRPANLRDGLPALRERLFALGLEREAPVFELSQLDASCDARARSLWDCTALLRAYRELDAALERSALRLPQLPLAAARVESFQLGGAAIRQLALDPLLPEALLPEAPRRALAVRLRRYDRLGRRLWRGWLGEDALHGDHALPVQGASEFARAEDHWGIA